MKRRGPKLAKPAARPRTEDCAESDQLSDIPDVNAVVKVFAIHADPNYALPWTVKHQTSSTSTGFAIRGPKGEKWLLTNAHSVENATLIQVRRRGGEEKFVAKVLCEGPDCDLALLQVHDSAFWTGLEPLCFTNKLPRLRDQVTVVGYPVGGDSFCVSKGVVSRIDLTQYAHSAHKLLACQIDAAINPGNSGGPVLSEDRECIGIAFQSLKDGHTENIGYVIPSEIAQHFLQQYIRFGKYTGFGTFGFGYQRLENPTMRKALKIPTAGGVLTKRVDKTAPAAKVLKVGDIVVGVEGQPVSCDGTVEFLGAERISFQYIVNRCFVGAKCKLDILRDGEQKTVTVEATRKTPLVPLHVYGPPEYLVVGGLIFVPLSEPYLRCEWGDEYEWDAPVRLISHLHYGHAEKQGEQVIILSSVLASELTIGFTDLKNVQLSKFNGTPVHTMRELCRQVDACKSEYMRFELVDNDQIVLRTKEARHLLPEILRSNMIQSHKSEGL